MEKRKTFLHCAGFLILLVAITGLCVVAGATEQTGPDAEKARTDMVRIDALGALGGLELPVVTFYHDRHTEALAKSGKSCDTCHKVKDGKMSTKYMRFEDADFETTKNIYHDNCFSCHAETKAKGEKSGPVDGECRRCHDAKPEPSVRVTAGFDNILHMRHWNSKQIAVKGEETNCGACHHVYDAAAKKTKYEKGKESTCRSCHEAKPTEVDGVTVRALSDAVHTACVSCHRENAEAKKETGPLTCAGCHSAEGQAATAKHDDEFVAKLGGELPRLPMKQPDTALLFPVPAKNADAAAPAEALKTAMPPVAFNHLAHEQKNDTCRACHHKETVACGACHTVTGDKKGGFVTLDQAMHQADSKRSCVGCHRQEQQKSQCAGCHAQMNTGARPADATCASCHKGLPEGVAMPESGEMAPEAKASVAAMMLQVEKTGRTAWSLDAIPEKVKIDGMAKEYAAAEFPHRKIVLALIKGMQKDELAQAFHKGDKLLCQGCHHNSPASATPPKCASCHAKPFDQANPNRPGLKAAYHGQCMGCHKGMDMAVLEKNGQEMPATSCVVCHDKKTD